MPELWNAHEHLDSRGKHVGNQYTGVGKAQNYAFSDYCEAIGITRQTGYYPRVGGSYERSIEV